MKNKKNKNKIDWENLFAGSSSTEEAMYYFLFGKYDIKEFKEACGFFKNGEGRIDKDMQKAFKQMRKMGVQSARIDCALWWVSRAQKRCRALLVINL